MVLNRCENRHPLSLTSGRNYPFPFTIEYVVSCGFFHRSTSLSRGSTFVPSLLSDSVNKDFGSCHMHFLCLPR